MSVLNLGLQCVGLMRLEMPEDFEAEARKCHSMADLRKVAESRPEFVALSLDSLSPVKILLTDFFQRLELKSKPFAVMASAAQAEIDEFWTVVMSIDDSLGSANDQYTKKTLCRLPRLKAFIVSSSALLI